MSARDDRRYARFYYVEFIRDYRAIYDDDAAFATWHRLLVAAEQAWPMTPEIPRSVKSRPLRTLVDAGLVAVIGSSFELKGHAAERDRRSNAGRVGAAVRWDSDGNANAMPSTSTSIDETSTTPPPSRAKGRTNGTNLRATGSNPRAQGTSPRQVREGYKTGPTALGAVMREIEGLKR